MKAAVISAPGRENLQIVELEDPKPAAHEVLVRVRAVSLNYRDLLTIEGGYGSRQKASHLIVLSDGAGEVAAVGEQVEKFAVGDRVMGNFFVDWVAGPPSQEKFAMALGGRVDGMACELRALPASAWVRTPDHLTDVEAATLPCAALTAWSAVVTQGQVGPGDVVLTQGTGGVSLFALQFAKLAGARVVSTSSSKEKLQRLIERGADDVINYVSEPKWARKVRELTDGEGVDHVVEVGGAGTVEQSIKATRPGGTISLIGVLSGPSHDFRLPLVVTQNIRLQGVTVGSREQFEAMTRAIALHGLRPPVDKVFPLEDIGAAIDRMQSGRHFGKVCLEIGSSS